MCTFGTTKFNLSSVLLSALLIPTTALPNCAPDIQIRSHRKERKNQAKRLETSGTCFLYPEGSERVTAAFILQGQMKRAPFPLPFLESGIQSFFIFSSPGISAVSYLPKSSYKVMLTVCTTPIIFSDFLLQPSPTMVRLIRHRCNLKITS